MSAASFRVAGLEAQPGTTVTGFEPVDVGTTVLQLPIAVIHGARPGPVLAITAGIHGGEYVSMLAVRKFVSTLDARTVAGTVIVSLQSSPAAFLARAEFVNPLDGRNLNRSFPGDAQGAPSERLAHWLWTNLISRADYFIDCHCGDLPEDLAGFAGVVLTGDREVEDAAFAMADCFPVPRTVAMKTSGTTLATAAEARIPSVLVELGQRGLWTDDEVRGQFEGLVAVAGHLGLVRSESTSAVHPRFEVAAGVSSEHDGLWFPAVRPGDALEEGTVIGTIEDPFGATLATITSPVAGIHLYGLASLAVRVGDYLAAIVRPTERVG